MINKSIVAAFLALSFGGAAQAQAQTCVCNGKVGTPLTTVAAIQTLISNKTVCAAVGGEQWQEWHNGGVSGTVVDYKLGPGHPVDPSSAVGSYQINDISNDLTISKAMRGIGATVAYTYGANTYTYGVCQTGATYAFCGAVFSGRDITNVQVTGAQQPCPGVAAATRAAGGTRK